MLEKLIRIKGKTFEDLTHEEIAEMILSDSAISPNGSELFSASALDEFLHNGVAYSPRLEKIRCEILEKIYIDIPGQKDKDINVKFLIQYSANLTK